MDDFTGEDIMTCGKFTLRTADIQETFCFNSYAIGEEWAKYPSRMVDCLMYNETYSDCFPICFPLCFNHDASDYSYARTETSNEIQYCDGNASPVGRSTPITKVEIRVHSTAMNSCGPLTAYIRPIFSGGDGDSHSWIPVNWTTEYTPPEWSEWFDVTSDTNAPGTWTWTDINNLGVDHWMVKSTCTDTNYLDTTRIEFRVTWYDSVELFYPLKGGLDNKLDKQLKPFNLWKDYALHDIGIEGQPLNLEGVEVGVAVGIKTAAQVAQEKFEKIHSWIENNYNVVLGDFGDCFNAEYSIKNFTVDSMNHPSNYSWKLSLEKAGD